MASEIDGLLARRLGRLGGPGARLAARDMPLDVGEQTVEIPHDIVYVRDYVERLYAAWGTPVRLESPEYASGQSAVVGSGEGNLNPAVVTIWLSESPDGGTIARVRASAKEGLMKQYGGQHTAANVAAALRDLNTAGA